MALPASGTLALTDIATEFGDTAPHSMSEFYRGGGKVPNSAGNSAVPASGAINVGGFYNAANRAAIALTIASNTQNYDVYSNVAPSPAYVAGTTDVTLTINSGIVVGSASTGSYAMSVPSSFNAGDTVTIVNNGTIIGRGGNGASAGPTFTTNNDPAGAPGGYGLYVNRATTITNNGTVAGGGGGGGLGGTFWAVSSSPKGSTVRYAGGGGGGGGAGYPAGSGGTKRPTQGPSTGGGSPGSAGTTTSGGAGGAGGWYNYPTYRVGGSGGAGGGQGAAGGSGGSSSPPMVYPAKGGGARGYYLVGNSNVTWSATGTRLGSVS